MAKSIFVFGSNTAGIHGAGAARTAHKQYGAIHGIGYGHVGSCFAIPTKDSHLESLDLVTISTFIDGFLAYARSRPDLAFHVTRIGCGLAGFKDTEIVPFFVHAPENCWFDSVWGPPLNWIDPDRTYNFWGTFE